MDALQLFAGINVAMVAGVIGILLGIRAVDRKKKLGKGAYVIGAMVLGFLGAACVTKPFSVSGWIVAGIAHAGAASILYQAGKLVLPGPDRYWLKRPAK
jgi:hypothetical protein